MNSLFARKPTDPTLRTVQLRTLTSVRRDMPSISAAAVWLP